MPTVASTNVALSLTADQYERGIDAAKKKNAELERSIIGLNQFLNGNFSKAFKAAFAFDFIEKIGRELEKFGNAARTAAKAFDSGETDVAGLAVELAKGVPVIGDLHNGMLATYHAAEDLFGILARSQPFLADWAADVESGATSLERAAESAALLERARSGGLTAQERLGIAGLDGDARQRATLEAQANARIRELERLAAQASASGDGGAADSFKSQIGTEREILIRELKRLEAAAARANDPFQDLLTSLMRQRQEAGVTGAELVTLRASYLGLSDESMRFVDQLAREAEAAERAAAQQRSVESHLESLREQADLVGRTADEYERVRLEAMGASEAQIQQAKELRDAAEESQRLFDQMERYKAYVASSQKEALAFRAGTNAFGDAAPSATALLERGTQEAIRAERQTQTTEEKLLKESRSQTEILKGIERNGKSGGGGQLNRFDLDGGAGSFEK